MKLQLISLATISCLFSFLHTAFAITCYECSSSHPGCGADFDFTLVRSRVCPRHQDKCVKIIERTGASVLITRACLSTIGTQRKDVPSDTYEGCRPAVVDPRLGHWVNYNNPHLEVQQYDSVEYCFCAFDQWCNSGSRLSWNIFNVLWILTSVMMVWVLLTSATDI